MSTPDKSAHSTHPTAQPWVRWAVPVTAGVIGVAYLIAGLVGDRPGFGAFGLVLMLAVGGGFLLLGTHSETVAGLIDRRDERINSIDRDATLASGGVLLVAVIVMFMVEVARGRDGSPYAQLGALAGVTYLGALAWLRWHR